MITLELTQEEAKAILLLADTFLKVNGLKDSNIPIHITQRVQQAEQMAAKKEADLIEESEGE